MKAGIHVLLGIGLLVAAAQARAAGWGEAMQFASVASPHDTSRVLTGDGRFHSLSWWRRDHRSRLSDGGEQRGFPGAAPSVSTLGVGTAESRNPVVDPSLYGADGNVVSMARSGSTLYIAGSFRSIGENSGGFVPFDTRTGQPLARFPKVAGSVSAIVPDGEGGWYIGGEFTGVGGVPRSCLAQIRADGSVSDWNPSVTGSPAYIDPPVVIAMAFCRGRLFVGGGFREIGGRPHMNLGCVDARTGAVLDWNLDTHVDGWVSSLAVHSDTLFVAGGFSSLGGQSRSSLAAVDASTGEVLPWRIDVFGSAYALLACGDTLYVGGDFLGIGGRPQSLLAAADIPSATLLPIDFRASGISMDYLPSPQVDGLARAGDTLYAVGNFSQIGGQIRSGIAALDATSGDALTWSPDTTDPRHEGYPPLLHTSVAVSGGVVYVGGYFERVAGTYHPYLAAWDRQTGRVLDWTPTPDDAVGAIAISGDTLYVGGDFHMVGGWLHRAGLAAIDLTSGRVKPWNPNPNGVICTAVAVRGDRVFVSGDFSIIGGDPQPRSYMAALDTLNGEVTGWDPGADNAASVLMLAGDTLYVGGMFTQLGGQPRSCLAAINATTGTVLPWDPSADWPGVLAMARSGDTIYLGGVFTQVGGQPRRGLAAVDAYTGTLSEWNPGTDNCTVEALLIAGGTLYVGGKFGTVGGEGRNAIAAVDLQTGAVLPWYPAPTGWGVASEVKAFALHDSLLYMGGTFATINGQPRICLAAVDTSTSLATGWDPGLDGYVWSLLSSGNTIYAGGGFYRAGNIPADGLAAFTLAPSPPPPPTALELAPCLPNPVRTSAVIRFGLPSAAPVTLWIFDLQGRRVASPFGHSLMGAGQHSVEIGVQGWRPGVYFYRLEAAGRTATRKMVILR